MFDHAFSCVSVPSEWMWDGRSSTYSRRDLRSLPGRKEGFASGQSGGSMRKQLLKKGGSGARQKIKFRFAA